MWKTVQPSPLLSPNSTSFLPAIKATTTHICYAVIDRCSLEDSTFVLFCRSRPKRWIICFDIYRVLYQPLRDGL